VSRQNYNSDLVECRLEWLSESCTRTESPEKSNTFQLRLPDNQEQGHSNAKLSDKFQLYLRVHLFYCTDCFDYILMRLDSYREMPFKKRVLGLIDLEINPI
jgi:hypothetical protein